MRAGLVRCWSCNGFMRDDVAKKYQDLTENPQPIIFSEGGNEGYIPARHGQSFGGYARKVYDAEYDDSEFTLDDGFEQDAPGQPG